MRVAEESGDGSRTNRPMAGVGSRRRQRYVDLERDSVVFVLNRRQKYSAPFSMAGKDRAETGRIGFRSGESVDRKKFSANSLCSTVADWSVTNEIPA
jgi:hypothetical protein